MIEEPYRWVEAVANRREYIETQLGSGSPIVALQYEGGILFVTLGRARQKLFEVYDRIGMGAIGHPGDIERLRMAAIELASTEGFTRSAADVSLRRLAYYSLSPVLKAAFEQVYGAPYLARMLFAEIGDTPRDDLFLRVEYDGAIATDGGTGSGAEQRFAALSGTRASTELMESFLEREHDAGATLKQAMNTALDAWVIGKMALGEDGTRDLPAAEVLGAEREKQVEAKRVEAAVIERDVKSAIRYRVLPEAEIESATAK
jgi:proteasome alpha subunit